MTSLRLNILTAAIGMGLSIAAHAQESIILATPMPEDHIMHTTAEAFMEALPEDSGLKVEYHPGGDLGDWTSLFEQVSQGVLPMSMTYAASDLDKRLDITLLPYAFKDWDSAEAAISTDGSLFPVYEDIYADLGMKLLGIIPVDFYGLAMRKGDERVPTTFPSDGKGIKLRVAPVAIGVEQFKTFGFSPVPMPYSELYTALQLGTVDGRAYATPVEIWQMRDVLSSYILTNDSFEQGAWVVNQQWWDGLSEEQQQAILSARDEALSVAWGQAQDTSETFKSQIREAGVEIVELSEEEMAQAEALARDEVWPWMEEQVGKELIDTVREATAATP
jgi:TRAP-type C4-dicarboxylate transport system substrate-binding protein